MENDPLNEEQIVEEEEQDQENEEEQTNENVPSSNQNSVNDNNEEQNGEEQKNEEKQGDSPQMQELLNNLKNNEKKPKKNKKNYDEKFNLMLDSANNLLKELKKEKNKNPSIKQLYGHLNKTIKQTKDKEGGTTLQDIVMMYKDLSNKYSDDNTIDIEEKDLNLTKLPDLLIKILLFFGFGSNYYNTQFKGDIHVKNNKMIQIVPLRSQTGHVGIMLLDNRNKKITIYDPNGDCLDNVSKFKGVKTKKQLLKKIFNNKDIKKLKDYDLHEAYRWTGCHDNDERAKKIFGDNISYIKENKNGSQTKKGACGVLAYRFVSHFLKTLNERGKKIDNYTDFLKDVNDRFESTSTSLMYTKLKKDVQNTKARLSNIHQQMKKGFF